MNTGNYTLKHKAYFQAQEIFSFNPKYPSCHASTIAALPGGDLMVAFYAGSVEKASDVTIFLSRFSFDDRNWFAPEIVIDIPDKSLGNPVLFLAPNGILWLFFLIMEGKKWYDCSLHYIQSSDLGYTWGTPQTLQGELGWTIRNNLIVLQNGEILFPLDDNRQGFSFFMISRDIGKTFQKLGRIVSDPFNEQPAVVQLSDGSLLCYARTFGKGGHCWASRSQDGGKTWIEAVPGPFKNPNSAMAMIRLASGNLVAVYNDSDNYRYRTPLVMSLSEDEGRTWPYLRVLEDQPGQFTYQTTQLDNSKSIEFSYPAIVQDEKGLIHITYTNNSRRNIKCVHVDEIWLRQTKKG
jgi:predicted neuraminidase